MPDPVKPPVNPSPAAWVVMGPSEHGARVVPLAVRRTLDEACAALAQVIKNRIRWGYGPCALSIEPTDEMIEDRNA